MSGSQSQKGQKVGQEYGDIRAPLPLDRLVPYLEANVDGWQGPLEIQQFKFGQSNPTYLLTTPRQSYVLRRAPSGPLLSPTAHRVDREFQILQSLNSYNAALSGQAREDHGIPVPKVFCLCMDPEVAGSAFYVMEFLKGRIFQDIRMPSLDQEERRQCWKSTIKTLTTLSTIPLSSLNLPSSFSADPNAKPYFTRQVNSLLKVSAAQSKARVKETGKEIGQIWGTKELHPFFVEGARRIGEWESERRAGCVVHGDFKIDNLASHPLPSIRPLPSGMVIGILDWELCTLGSPLSDLGNLLLPFSFAPITESSFPNRDTAVASSTGLMTGLKGLSTQETGLPQNSEIEQWWVEGMNQGLRYQSQRAGGASGGQVWSWPIGGLEWVRSWILFRLAVICQGIAARAALGQASSADATADDSAFNFFGRMAWEAKKGEEAQSRAKL